MMNNLLNTDKEKAKEFLHNSTELKLPSSFHFDATSLLKNLKVAVETLTLVAWNGYP
jgi:hypothetical protein